MGVKDFKQSRRREIVTGIAACLAMPWASRVWAAAYPESAVKIVVPYAPGGANDAVARLIAQTLSERLKHPFVVDNRPGAGGSIGTTYVARSKPDGHTLLLGATGAMTINPNLSPNLSYDVQRDFVPVGLVSRAGLALVTPTSLQVGNLAQLTQYAKRRKGISYASPGPGTPGHLAGELFARQAGIKSVHVPYKGSSPAITDLVAGQVDMMFDGVITTAPFVKQGRLKALAVSTPQRISAFGEVPTLQECGFKDFDVSSWCGVFAPSGTPAEIVRLISAELEHCCALPGTREKMAAAGLEVVSETSEQLGKRVKRETARWRDLIKVARIKAE